MPVYVDDSSIPATVPNGRARHASTWCHMFADTQEELHEFAARIGMKRAWFQPGRPRGDGTPSALWHYDVTAPVRRKAVKAGAIEVTWRESVAIMRAREAGQKWCLRCRRILVDRGPEGWFYQEPVTDPGMPGLTFMDQIYECEGQPHLIPGAEPAHPEGTMF